MKIVVNKLSKNKLSKKQIDNKLKVLRESRNDEDTYYVTRLHLSFACCYCLAPFQRHYENRVCGSCGKDFEITWTTGCDLASLTEVQDRRPTVEEFESIVKKYIDVGLQARFICNCSNCVELKNIRPHEIWIKAFDENDWHISVPNVSGALYSKKERYTSVFEYDLVLKFLTVSEETDDLPTVFDNLYNIEFRKEKLEFYVGEDVIKRQKIVESCQDKWEREEKKRQKVCDNPKLFYSGNSPIDFYAEKNLTVMRALSMIKEHIIPHSEYFFGDFEGHIFERPKCVTVFDDFKSFFAKRYSALTYKGIIADVEIDAHDDLKKNGFIKTQIDIALGKVLGLTVIYDKEEMRNNIACILKEFDKIELIDKAYEMLETCSKEVFTAFDCDEFMNAFFKKYKIGGSDFMDVFEKYKIGGSDT